MRYYESYDGEVDTIISVILSNRVKLPMPWGSPPSSTYSDVCCVHWAPHAWVGHSDGWKTHPGHWDAHSAVGKQTQKLPFQCRESWAGDQHERVRTLGKSWVILGLRAVGSGVGMGLVKHYPPRDQPEITKALLTGLPLSQDGYLPQMGSCMGKDLRNNNNLQTNVRYS